MIPMRNVVESVSFYPLTALYVSASGTLIAVSTGTASLLQGIGTLALLTALAMLASTQRELRRVHALVNAAHTELRARNRELQQLLDSSNEQWALLMQTVRQMDERNDSGGAVSRRSS